VTTKLHINVHQGIVEAEGDEQLVREIYLDFKSEILALFQKAASVAPTKPTEVGGGQEAQNLGSKSQKKSKPKSSTGKPKSPQKSSGASSYTPKLEHDTDTSGCLQFYNKYKPKSHSEHVLVFAKYLQSIGLDTVTANQIYTCYVACKAPMPKAFLQAIRDAHSKKNGFVRYTSPDDISITHIGEGKLNSMEQL